MIETLIGSVRASVEIVPDSALPAPTLSQTVPTGSGEMTGTEGTDGVDGD
jgi:hypothetical protein